MSAPQTARIANGHSRHQTGAGAGLRAVHGKALLSLEDFSMHYGTRDGAVRAVDNVTFELHQGQALGLVGESGCGKTSIAMSILKLLPYNAHMVGGHIFFDGVDLVPLSEDEMRPVRWKGVSMIFQAAMNSLNPVYRVGDQIIEAITTHEPNVSVDEARERVTKLYDLVGLDPKRLDHYPHEYSGGMKQRAVIAMSLACNPKLVIADEPTTALDVIVQDKILKEMDEIRRKLNMSMIYISHDIAVIAEVSEVMGVMYAGKLVEFGPVGEVFKNPLHPYTEGLMSAFPSIKGEKRPLITIGGEPPNLLTPPSGCRFHPRCKYQTGICQEKEPEYQAIKDGHYTACWHPRG